MFAKASLSVMEAENDAWQCGAVFMLRGMASKLVRLHLYLNIG